MFDHSVYIHVLNLPFLNYKRGSKRGRYVWGGSSLHPFETQSMVDRTGVNKNNKFENLRPIPLKKDSIKYVQNN